MSGMTNTALGILQTHVEIFEQLGTLPESVFDVPSTHFPERF